MHLPINRNNIIYILCVFLCALIFTFVIAGTLFAIPKAVTYHPLKDSTQVLAESPGIIENKCLFDYASDIRTSGPFLIRLDGDSIYVFSGKDRLYRIKTKPENFSRADRSAIITGISADTREKLFELIEYMES